MCLVVFVFFLLFFLCVCGCISVLRGFYLGFYIVCVCGLCVVCVWCVYVYVCAIKFLQRCIKNGKVLIKKIIKYIFKTIFQPFQGM